MVAVADIKAPWFIYGILPYSNETCKKALCEFKTWRSKFKTF
ncbi:hypothetical protein MIZ03_2182 [Rhodoferax lithotrophicus]|uniref:Uncharacterized protein n=1 Tax=Rhodoferax lithotrophicus TaxID=2798804 RepID=A0ABN6D5N1_9BURK|nr:hypothetical protein MIZ03_2182 [Rhodoferax sp. MIZ03]